MLLFTVPCNLERFFSIFVKTSLTSGLEVSLILEISLFKSLMLSLAPLNPDLVVSLDEVFWFFK
mgnify:CR=1 FL=1